MGLKTLKSKNPWIFFCQWVIIFTLIAFAIINKIEDFKMTERTRALCIVLVVILVLVVIVSLFIIAKCATIDSKNISKTEKYILWLGGIVATCLLLGGIAAALL